MGVGLNVPRHEQHRITCPYCIIGKGFATVIRTGIEVRLQDAHIQCVGCKRYFRLQTQLRIVGRKLEDTHRLPQSPPVGAN